MTTTIAEWLRARGHDDSDATRRFLLPKLAHLSPPDGMADRVVAADRLAHAIRRGERIVVFGDYDCDGITSAAIMTEVLRALGGDVVPLLASRFDGGYGVSEAARERIAATGAAVLVTCDCGSSDHASLAELRARGIDAIVIDHHLVPDEPLPALAFLNPHRPDCGFSYKGLASCGLALNIGAALRTALGQKLDMRPWLDLVAIGTIADVAPLDGDNRALVRAGLGVLAAFTRPGLRALAAYAKIDGAVPLSARDVAFRIAPRLNAPGRLGSPDLALQLLLAKSEAAASDLAAQVEAISERRRELQETITAEAFAEIERDGYADRPAIVVGREGWNFGVVGIVAGRLADRYGRPVVVVGFDGGVGRGSVRGPAGSRLHDALSSIAPLLDRFGGHQAAAGLEVRRERLGELRDAFSRAVEAQGAPSSRDDGVLVRFSPDDDPFRVATDIERLEPCGHCNPAPRLVLDARVDEAREVRGGHLKLDLSLGGGRRVRGFGVGMGELAATLSGAVTVLGELRRDSYMGGNAVEIKVERILT
ncbi:MAG TPA: single-stranded-DNA-specific exonuclease RecJ [Polyangiaceae bacterium]|nr:single-stranded-DNA-specific exonuclease RecJ [Polyangiaceae bacterium]